MAQIATSALKTVHVIGDSHALGFKGKSVALPQYGLVANASVEYIPAMTPDKFVENRQLRPEIVHYFLRNGIMTREGIRAAATADGGVIGAQYATGMGFERPMVIFIAGDILIRNFLEAVLASGPLKISVAHEFLTGIVESYVRTIASIRSKFGLYGVIHEVCPPTADDAKFAEINKFNCPAELRADVYNIFNALLLEYTTKHHVPFCRSADYLAENGLLKEEYEFDGVHADPKYAYTSLERAVSYWLHTRGGEQTDRYTAWCKMIDPAFEAEITRIGASQIHHPFDASQLDTLRRAIGHFEGVICKQPKLDWAHQPPTMGFGLYNHSITYGDISPEGLALLRKVLIEGPFGDTIRKAFGAWFSIVNVRPVHSVAHDGEGVGQQGMHRDGCPPGVFRALIYLNDVGPGDGPFEYIPVGSETPTQVTGKAGSMVLFDANTVMHRATPPRTGERLALDLIFLVQPESCTEIVDCQVGFNWPIDPFMFSVGTNCVPRLKADRWFYPAFVAPKIANKPAATPPPAAPEPKRAVG
jgi:hypothetical protein